MGYFSSQIFFITAYNIGPHVGCRSVLSGLMASKMRGSKQFCRTCRAMRLLQILGLSDAGEIKMNEVGSC